MSLTSTSRGVSRLGGVIAIDWPDHCASLRQEADSLFLQVVLLTEQRATLHEALEASEATAAALFARVRELEARDGNPREWVVRPPASRLAACWAAACLAWFNFWQIFESDESREGASA